MTSEKIALTDAKLRKLKPQDEVYEIRDAGASGLRIRVWPSGKIVYRWAAKDAQKKNIVKTLGEYPALSLSEARTELDKLKAKHATALATGVLESEKVLDTVEQLAKVFYERRLLTQRKRPEEAMNIMRVHILPMIGDRKLSSLTPRTCRALVEKVVDGGSPARAVSVLALLKQLLSFGVGRGDLEINPAFALKWEDLGAVQNVRNRYLTGEEIRHLYIALDEHTRLSIQTKLCLKILLLTAARTGELLRAKWKNVDLDNAEWTIPVEDQKLSKKRAMTAKPFVVTLSTQAVQLFKQAQAITGDKEFVMATESKEGRIEDKVLGHALRRMFESKRLAPDEENGKYVVHDLRRTCRTHLGSGLKVPPHIAELCLNHSLGKIVATYDVGDYRDERREAMQRWADRVDIFTGEAGNVETLRETA